MTKTNKIIYWTATAWLALGMLLLLPILVVVTWFFSPGGKQDPNEKIISVNH